MRNQIFALITLLSTPLAIATPHPPPTSAPSATVTPPSSYYLQTRVIGQGHPEKDGLYVCAYHTGPGTADLTLQSIDAAAPAFFNSGYQEFNLDPPEPFGITMGDYDNGGTGWNFVTTAPGYGDGGFFFNESGLQFEGLEDMGFGGWIACDWWHGVPQLFWRDRNVEVGLPGSCAEVELLPVGI